VEQVNNKKTKKEIKKEIKKHADIFGGTEDDDLGYNDKYSSIEDDFM
jgi:hypothetical protein